ncbi:MAG: ribosome biogenesis GTPase Der [Chloroflexi bacterium]|nr:ribosome biogenesis GTPase Der [Chloroflexota bacterium]
MTKPIVTIVGRPNVGKSTLFNRLLGDRRAVVEDLPGTTRDRVHANTSWEGHEFIIVDSGGFESRPETAIGQKVKQQVEAAIAEADLVIFMVDAREGLMPGDYETADVLRRSRKPVILVANKVDSARQQGDLYQFFELSIGDPIPISSYHGKGIDELLNTTVAHLPPASPATNEAEATMKIAIVGKPNVGKSLLVNTLLGEDRLVVDETPGTTRDSVDTTLIYGGEKVTLIDTAGIRRRGRVDPGVEQYSVMRAQRAIERADVALLLADASEGITAQDMHILGYIRQALKGAILAVNKWDLVPSERESHWTELVSQKARFMPYIEILFISAKTGYGVSRVLPTAKTVYAERLRRPAPSSLSDVIREATSTHLPPKKGKRKLMIFRVAQTGVNPPTFEFSVNDTTLVHFSYRRYLENRLRQSFGFRGTPLNLVFKNRSQPVDVDRE